MKELAALRAPGEAVLERGNREGRQPAKCHGKGGIGVCEAAHAKDAGDNQNTWNVCPNNEPRSEASPANARQAFSDV